VKVTLGVPLLAGSTRSRNCSTADPGSKRNLASGSLYA